MTVLVAGRPELRAGKTTLAAALCARAGAVGFKPRAASDYWHHHDTCRKSLAEGRLVGSDARRLAAASPGETDPGALTAVHRLWIPTPGRTGMLGQAGRALLVDQAGESLVVNGRVEPPDRVREGLPLSEARVVSDLDELDTATRELHLPAQTALAADVAAADRAVVESYADVARPVDVDPAVVAVVEPGRLRVYDGRRYGRACEVAGGDPTLGRLEERVDDVIELLEPATTARLPPLPTADRTDPERAARAYADALDPLLSRADWDHP